MTTRKDQEVDRIMRKDLQNINELRDGGMTQYDNSPRSRSRMSSEKVCKRKIDELKDGGMPQCEIVTNIRHRMSPNKTLWDMPNDDAMKKHIQSLNEQMLKQVQASPKLC